MDIEQKFTTCGPYKILKTLGSGYSAKVKLGTKGNGEYAAIKMFNKDHAFPQNIKAFANEINIMKQLNHPNLVNLIDYQEDMPYTRKNGQQEKRLCMIFELAQGGDLLDFILKTGSLREEICRFYFRQLIEALQYMNSRGISHRDLKPENVLFDHNFNLKVADFGFAVLNDKYGDQKLRTVLGTKSITIMFTKLLAYMAPEIIDHKPYIGEQVDLFAAAIILFNMYTGQAPFNRADTNDAFYKCFVLEKNDIFWRFHSKRQKDEKLFCPAFKYQYSNQEDILSRNLLNELFSMDPNKRPNIQQVLDSEWLKGPSFTLEQIQCEFARRKATLDYKMEKDKLKKQAEKQQRQNQSGGIMSSGVGRFRGIGDGVDFSEIEQKYGLNQDTRQIDVYDEQSGKATDFFTTIDKDLLFKCLLHQADQYCSKILKVSEKKYKFSARKVDENNEVVDFDVELRQTVHQDIHVDFLKKEGDSLIFHEITKSLKKLTKNI